MYDNFPKTVFFSRLKYSVPNVVFRTRKNFLRIRIRESRNPHYGSGSGFQSQLIMIGTALFQWPMKKKMLSNRGSQSSIFYVLILNKHFQLFLHILDQKVKNSDLRRKINNGPVRSGSGT